MTTASDLARQLKAKKTGPSTWMAKCPGHDDGTASLSIGEGENGKLLLKCFAGCEFEAILKAAGVDPTKPNGAAGKPKIVARYTYRDARGNPVFEVRRYEPKDFRQARYDPATGTYISSKGCMQGVELVPYRLPEIVNASELFICEGEKDCDRLAALGLVATTNPGGAGKWPKKIFAGWFDGRHAVILPDNDDAGRKHAADVAAKLQATAGSVRILELPGLPEKGDVCDWLANGGTAEELQELAAAAPYREEGEATDGPDLLTQIKAQLLVWPALVGRKAPRRHFILPDWLPTLCVILLHGFGGVGKTLLAQQIGTACILRCQFLGAVADACPILGWFGEDDHDEIWRRQENINAAFGINSLADLEGKLFWRACPGDDLSLFSGTSPADFRIMPLFDVLRAQIIETSARLTILDSATQIAAISENDRGLVTRCIQALNRLCLETGTTIILIGHDNRTGDFSGSTAWENRVRSRIHMKREKDEDGSETIKLCRPKANYAATEDGVALEWHQGAYRCTDHRFETFGDRLEREMRDREIDQAFLVALAKLTDRHLTTSHNRNAMNYAPRVMAQNGVCGEFKERDMEHAMRRLFRDDRIIADAQLWQKPNRHFASGLAAK